MFDHELFNPQLVLVGECREDENEVVGDLQLGPLSHHHKTLSFIFAVFQSLDLLIRAPFLLCLNQLGGLFLVLVVDTWHIVRWLHETLMEFFHFAGFVLVLSIHVEAQRPIDICQQPSLDALIEQRIRCEAGHLIDLYQHWLQILFQHNIEAKDLKAHHVLEVKVGLAGPAQV